MSTGDGRSLAEQPDTGLCCTTPERGSLLDALLRGWGKEAAVLLLAQSCSVSWL